MMRIVQVEETMSDRYGRQALYYIEALKYPGCNVAVQGPVENGRAEEFAKLVVDRFNQPGLQELLQLVAEFLNRFDEAQTAQAKVTDAREAIRQAVLRSK